MGSRTGTHEFGSHFFDVCRRVMFGKGIGEVIFARPIVDEELFLAYATFEPMPSHVHGFGPFLFHGSVGKTFGRGIVNLNRCGWLRVTEFGLGGDDGDCILTVQIPRANLGLGSGSNDNIDDFTHSVDGTVQSRDGIWWLIGVEGFGAKEEMAGSATAGFSFRQIRRVTVYV